MGINAFEKSLTTLKEAYKIEIFLRNDETEDFNLRPEYPHSVIKSSSIIEQNQKLSYLSQYGIEHIALIFVFPTQNENEEWDVCIVHHPRQDRESAQNRLLAFMDNYPNPELYNLHCVKGRYIEECESGFYMLLYAYLGFQSKLLSNFLHAMTNASQEPDLKVKCRQWIQAVHRTRARVILPWMTQLTWDPSLQESPINHHHERNEQHSETNHDERRRRRARGEEGSQRKKKRSSTTMNENKHVTKANYSGNMFSRPIKHLVGLKNPKNLCYINVIIQLLYGMKCTRNHILNFELPILRNTAGRGVQNTSEALKNLFKKMIQENIPVSVMEFKKIVTENSLFQEFQNNQQHDAAQFLMKILQSIMDDFSSRNDDTISELFCSRVVSRVHCHGCHKVFTNTNDHSSSIELPIVGNTLEQCMSNFFDYEELDKDRICQNCKIRGNASKYSLLGERPILITSLKRFNAQCQKISTKVTFPLENLSLHKLMKEKSNVCSGTQYSLFAVINHFGRSSESGHYVLFMRSSEKWYKFNDEIIEEIRKESIVSSNAYTLIYIDREKFEELGT
jgi:ubiquitin C-terminal hydrolase